MTAEQAELFARESAFGFALGLDHPFEWLFNSGRSLHCHEYGTIAERQEMIDQAFLAWFRQTECGPGDPKATWTVDDMYQAMNDWYARPKEA
jgi:hypothetical protein